MRIFKPCLGISRSFPHIPRSHGLGRSPPRRIFLHTTPYLATIQPFLLPDIGEGITEVQIIQWFVEPEARVEQFDKLCEVQSDKAAAEITSRFDGVIKKIHYAAEDMAQVGKPLCDIDTYDDTPEDQDATAPSSEQAGSTFSPPPQQRAVTRYQDTEAVGVQETKVSGKHGALATPAVRGLLQELDINIQDVTGTGKDGRVMKDDVHRYAAARDANADPTPGPSSPTPSQAPSSAAAANEPQTETRQPLTPIQNQMFKTMTRSLTIPHFLYADEIDLTPLTALRHRLNPHAPTPAETLSSLPFIIKAVSLALTDFPLLNARVDIPTPSSSSSQPHLTLRAIHNIGVAMDTPHGLLVPTIKNVSSLSIAAIATDLKCLHRLATTGKLTPADLAAGTFTVSNIGSIGGTYVAPLLVPSEVAILAVGRARAVPAFDPRGDLVRREQACFSWCADHRVVDGATLARMAQRVRALVEEPALMLVGVR